VKVHYEGSPVSTKLLSDHDACIAEWKAIRKSHLANTKENYSDIAYNYGACPHGYLLEGRGIGKRTGANGNQTLNKAHYAIVGLVGSSGLTDPTDAMLGAIRDGIELLRNHGAGDEIKGHKDGYATACPGKPLYTWVQAGAPRPAGTGTAEKPAVDLSNLVRAFEDYPKHPAIGSVKDVQKALAAEGLYSWHIDGVAGPTTRAAYAKWQRRCAGGTGSHTGIPGVGSLTKLGQRHGFTVVS
jgi:hypothetical protein